MNRDDFTRPTIELIARRAGYRCSNPSCRRPTQGPDQNGGAASIGVAAHISAASSGGPRYMPEMSPDERRDSSNGIWLCQSCSRLIDTDVQGHSAELLKDWKSVREQSAALELRGYEVIRSRGFADLERKLPNLVQEMRDDLERNPVVREFFCIGRQMGWGGSSIPMFSYYYEDHENLLSQLQIMENYGAIFDSRINDVPRYRFSEDFVDYLLPNNN